MKETNHVRMQKGVNKHMVCDDSATGPILDRDMIVPEKALNTLTYSHRIQQRGMNVTTRNGIADPCQNIVAVFIQR